MKNGITKSFDYSDLNKGFDTLIFRLGSSAGLFSEFNNMILAMVYCLEKNIQFQLYSKNASYSEDGWLDFFEPFTDHHNDSFNDKFNHRPYVIALPKESIFKSFFDIPRKKKILRTQHVWKKIRKYKYARKINIPAFKGTLVEMSACIIHNIWKYNQKTQDKIDALLSSITIPEEYIAVHIRRGDKDTEAPHTELDAYFKKIEGLELSHLPVFLATDDSLIIEEVQKKFPLKKIFYLPYKRNTGFFMEEFRQLSEDKKYEEVVQLLAEIEIMKKSTAFIGTYSSNIGMFLSMARQDEMTFGIDYAHWKVI
ncbi:hypothetical protein [Chitinophaga sp. HK235]|uniref:hypothetical protein n=1 Tax=Chitinophaga sp. HK235 TaxID=2952571 RepID=UPI001BAD1CC6|nr:hypothetical protein [Chitinophaga sp. HK235]